MFLTLKMMNLKMFVPLNTFADKTRITIKTTFP